MRKMGVAISCFILTNNIFLYVAPVSAGVIAGAVVAVVAVVLIILIVLLIVSFVIYHNKGEKNLYMCCESSTRTSRILVANYNAVVYIHACVTLKCANFLACTHALYQVVSDLCFCIVVSCLCEWYHVGITIQTVYMYMLVCIFWTNIILQ